jgi:Arc/MetJ family transcription regulator
MRTNIEIDDELMADAQRLSGLQCFGFGGQATL